MDTTLESFINFCDDMQIVDEDFKSFKNNVLDFVDMFVRKARDLINRMILSLRKFKKYKVPDEVRKNIVKVRSSCDALWFRLISDCERPYMEYDDIDKIKTSKEYTDLFLSQKIYSDEDYLDVPTNAVIADLQKLNKTLTNTEILYNKLKRRNDIINENYWNEIISVLQISIKALNMYFKFGKDRYSNENNIVDMPEFDVEIIDS